MFVWTMLYHIKFVKKKKSDWKLSKILKYSNSLNFSKEVVDKFQFLTE